MSARRFIGLYSATARLLAPAEARSYLSGRGKIGRRRTEQQAGRSEGAFAGQKLVPPELPLAVARDPRALHEVLLGVWARGEDESSLTTDSKSEDGEEDEDESHSGSGGTTSVRRRSSVGRGVRSAVFLMEIPDDELQAGFSRDDDGVTNDGASAEAILEGSHDLVRLVREEAVARYVEPQAREAFSLLPESQSEGFVDHRWGKLQSREDRESWRWYESGPLASELFEAAEGDDADRVCGLVDKGVSVNARKQKHGYTPLHVAVQNDCMASARALVDCGADVNVAAANGATPLHWCGLASGSPDMVRFLLERGADPHSTTITWVTDSVFGRASGRTPLHWAAESGNTAVVKALLSAGTLAELRDERGVSPRDVDVPLFREGGRTSAEAIEEALNEYAAKKFHCVLLEVTDGLAVEATDAAIGQFANDHAK
jgi:Ankyrin repeats (3 copies)/Ankyrin repeat